MRARFSHPKLATLRIGRSADTSEGVDDTFALLSISGGLDVPLLSELQWYRRVSPRGAVLVHDFDIATVVSVRGWSGTDAGPGPRRPSPVSASALAVS